jgi:hypothetical protein
MIEEEENKFLNKTTLLQLIPFNFDNNYKRRTRNKEEEKDP